jgi:hypothetical protein
MAQQNDLHALGSAEYDLVFARRFGRRAPGRA